MSPIPEDRVDILLALTASTSFLIGVPVMLSVADRIERRLDEPAH